MFSLTFPLLPHFLFKPGSKEVCIRSEYLREWGSCVDKGWPRIVCSYPDSLVFWSCLNLAECSSVQSLSHVRLLATPWTAAYQAPLSMGFSRQEYWSRVPLPSSIYKHACLQIKYPCFTWDLGPLHPSSHQLQSPGPGLQRPWHTAL